MTAIYLNVNEHGLDESMRRFGTTPWQNVANAPHVEPRVDGHEDEPTTPQETVN
jgi:hypothetical protein